LDGFAVPAPAQVTQTVGTPLAKSNKNTRLENAAKYDLCRTT